MIVIGNSDVTAGNIENYSREENRRIVLLVGISYDDDIRRAREVILDEISKTGHMLSDPAPFVGVCELGDNSVNLAVRPRCKSVDLLGRVLRDHGDPQDPSRRRRNLVPLPATRRAPASGRRRLGPPAQPFRDLHLASVLSR
jgi:small-conductance mechanosensitive channel